MSTNVRKKSWTHPFIRMHTKSKWGLFWAEIHPQSKFHGNQLSSFCVILLINHPTYKQTGTGENITSLAELITEVNSFWGGTSAALGAMHLFRMKLGTV